MRDDDPVHAEPVDLDALRRLEQKATPGPWVVRKFAPNLTEVLGADVPVVFWPGFDDSAVPLSLHRTNAALIAAARNALPGLLAELASIRLRASDAEAGEKTAVDQGAVLFGQVESLEAELESTRLRAERAEQENAGLRSRFAAASNFLRHPVLCDETKRFTKEWVAFTRKELACLRTTLSSPDGPAYEEPR